MGATGRRDQGCPEPDWHGGDETRWKYALWTLDNIRAQLRRNPAFTDYLMTSTLPCVRSASGQLPTSLDTRRAALLKILITKAVYPQMDTVP